MKTIKILFATFVMATILVGCESETRAKIRGTVKGMNERCPIVLSQFHSITSVELDEDTPEALAKEIMRFHDMKPEERDQIGKNARKLAEDKFDRRNSYKELINRIDTV